MKKIASVSLLCFLSAGCQTTPLLSYQPEVWRGDAAAVSVTRPGMATSTDTTLIANQHCAQFGKVATLTKLASPLQLPNRDEFACVDG